MNSAPSLNVKAMKLLKSVSFVAALLVPGFWASAQEQVEVTRTETVTVVEDGPDMPSKYSQRISQFTWGADLGSTIDMTGQDLTAIDIAAYAGYRCNQCRFIGLGAEVKMMVSNSSRCYPVFAMVRTGFSNGPRLLFLDARAGMSFNNLHNDVYQRSLYGSLGFGVTLAHSRKFSSHIILSYEIIPLKDKTINEITYKLNNLQGATIRIGAAF